MDRVALVIDAGQADELIAELAGQLRDQGAKVVVAGRSMSTAIMIARRFESHVVPFQVELDDARSISTAAQLVEIAYGRLDMLLINGSDEPRRVRSEGSKVELATLVSGVSRLVHTFLPVMRRAPQAQILVIGDDDAALRHGGHATSAGWAGALHTLAAQLAQELTTTSVAVKVVRAAAARDVNGTALARRPAAVVGAAAILRDALAGQGASGVTVNDERSAG